MKIYMSNPTPVDYDQLRNIRDALSGNISRISVSNDITEVDYNMGVAIERIIELRNARANEIQYNYNRIGGEDR